MTAKSGQAVGELALLAVLIVAVLSAMQPYFRRGIQAGIKAAADRIGDQANGIRQESGDLGDKPLNTPGTVLVRASKTTTSTSKNVFEGAGNAIVGASGDYTGDGWQGHCSESRESTAGGRCKEYKGPDSIKTTTTGVLDSSRPNVASFSRVVTKSE